MRRQLSILLFLAIVLASLASALVVATLTYREMATTAKQNIDGLHEQLRNRVHTFDLLLTEQEEKLNNVLQGKLPRVAADIARLADDPRTLSHEQLDVLCNQYDLGYLYILDRNGKVVNTNFKPDMGLDLSLASKAMRQLLERLYRSGEVFSDRFNASVHTGRLHKYSYYGPSDQDYLVEASVDLREFLRHNVSPRLDQFLFKELFDLAPTRNKHILDFDIFVVTNYGGWSLLTEGQKLPDKAADAFKKSERTRFEVDNGDHVTVYERLSRLHGNLGETDSLVTRVTYDLSDQTRFLYTSLGFAFMLAMVFGMLAFLVARVIFHRRLLQPVTMISDHLQDTTHGGFHRMPPAGVSELDVITRGVNLMLDRISDREARLIDAQRQLEHRVHERTAELEAANEKLAHLATTDPLTGLANRRSFFESAEQELSRARRQGSALVVGMIDLDYFKQINDRYGHSAGDRILECVSEIFRNELRDIDRVARLGGEEFGVLLIDVTTDEAVEIIERIRDEVSHCVITDAGNIIKVTLSAGIAMCDPTHNDLSPYLALADRALYEAKRQGRNRVVVKNER